MTRRQLNLSLILIFAIATIIAMLFVFNPNIAYAEDTYTITWVNGETTLETDTEVAAGATPTYDGATPTKSSDAEYTYTFAGWSPEVYAADKDQTYTATFTPTIRSYKFTLNAYKQDAIGDGYTLEVIEDTYEAEYGKTITDADIDNIAHFHYVANTNEQFVTITENEATNVVTAYFDRDICSIIYVDDIVMLAELEARYGAPTPTIDDPQDYYDNYQIYEFNGWSPAIKETVEGSQTYTAQITATERKYHAIWQNYDGTQLYELDNVKYGSLTYGGETPTREPDAQYTYTFDDWDVAANPDDINDLIYTATYSTTTNTYTITWVHGSNVLETDNDVPYGEMPSYDSLVPDEDSIGHSHIFVGWSPEVATVVGDQTYTAVFNVTVDVFRLTYGTGENDYMDVTYGTSYTLPILTQDGKWLDHWNYVTTPMAGHDGVPYSGVYDYDYNVTLTPIWIDFDITVDTHFVSVEAGLPATYQLTVTSTGDITYTSSNENAFLVSQTGLVTCVGKGRSTITIAQASGGTSETCVFVSVDKIIANVDNILNITINEGINNQRYMVLCNSASTVEYVSDALLASLNITNDYVTRTDIGVEIEEDLKIYSILPDESVMNINLIYNIIKATNTLVSYRVSEDEAEYNTKVFILDLIPTGDSELGNIIVKNDLSLPVEISQQEKSFIMPAADVTTDILMKEVPVTSKTIRKVEVKSKAGFEAGLKITVEKKDSFNQSIQIPQNKEAAAIINIKAIKGEEELTSIGEYTITITVPEDILGRDGVEVFYLKDGETITKQVYFEGREITLTLTGVGDIVFAANVHESTTYLYWLIIMLLFFDSFLGMIVIILATNYTDALARRKALNGYSVAFLPIVLLGAIVPAEIAVVAFLGVVFVAELIAIAWLSLKLSNKYFMYTTYHKLYMPKYDDEDYQ